MAAILAIWRAPYILVKVLCSLDCINYCSNCKDFDSFIPIIDIKIFFTQAIAKMKPI
jgi:hypothetical protein